MKTTTLTAMRAILESDPARTQADREMILQTLGMARAVDVATPADRLIPFEEAARLLNRTTKSVHMLAKRGILRKALLPGFVRCSGVLASDIDNLLKSSVCGQGVAS